VPGERPAPGAGAKQGRETGGRIAPNPAPNPSPAPQKTPRPAEETENHEKFDSAQPSPRCADMRNELLRRQVHGDVLKFCTAELVKDDYFHAVLEATKSVSQKIRDKTGLTGDGGELATKALSLGQAGMPFLAFNALRNDSEKSEQSGLMNLALGVFSTFRNPTAHAPRIHWNVSEQDAVDLLTMASFLHRRLDAAARTPRQF
jgi:uncharacterized protein (TIGR02391 family)